MYFRRGIWRLAVALVLVACGNDSQATSPTDSGVMDSDASYQPIGERPDSGDPQSDGGSSPFTPAEISGSYEQEESLPPKVFLGGAAFFDPTDAVLGVRRALKLVFTDWPFTSCDDILKLDADLIARKSSRPVDSAYLTCTMTEDNKAPNQGYAATDSIVAEQGSGALIWETRIPRISCFPLLNSGNGVDQSGVVSGTTRFVKFDTSGALARDYGTLSFDLPYCGEFDAQRIGGN